MNDPRQDSIPETSKREKNGVFMPAKGEPTEQQCMKTMTVIHFQQGRGQQMFPEELRRKEKETQADNSSTQPFLPSFLLFLPLLLLLFLLLLKGEHAHTQGMWPFHHIEAVSVSLSLVSDISLHLS